MFSKVSGKVEGQENGNEEDVRHGPREDAEGIALMEAKPECKSCVCVTCWMTHLREQRKMWGKIKS